MSIWCRLFGHKQEYRRIGTEAGGYPMWAMVPVTPCSRCGGGRVEGTNIDADTVLKQAVERERELGTWRMTEGQRAP